MDIKRIDFVNAKLVVKLFDQYRVFYKQVSDINLAEQFIKERLMYNDSVIFVALSENKPIAFTQLYPKFSSVSALRNWHIGDLYVEPTHRKKGIGKKLLEQAYDFAKEDGANFISLNTADGNLTAQKLYKDFGFIEQETSPGFLYYKIDFKEVI